MADEVMPAIVETEVRQFRVLAGGEQGFVEGDQRNIHLAPAGRGKQPHRVLRSAIKHVLQVFFQLSVEIHNPMLAVFG